MADNARESRGRRDDVREPGWPEQAQLLDWIRRPRPGSAAATLNACYNAVDRHVVRGHGDRAALVHTGSGPGVADAWSFAELLERTAAFAGALQSLGAGPAGRVRLRLPQVPEAVVAVLACARIGAVATVLVDDPCPGSLEVHLDTATVVLRGAGTVPADPRVDPGVDSGVVDWDTAMRAGAADPAACMEVAAAEPLYEVRDPAGGVQVRETGRHSAALAWSAQHRLGVHAGQVWWSTWPLGSAIGLDHGILAPLLAGATSVLHADGPGGATDPSAFRRVVAEYGVDAVLTDAATVRALVEDGPATPPGAGLSLRAIHVAGEELEPDLHALAVDVLGVPVRAWA